MASKKIIGKRIQNVFLGAKKGYLKTVYKPGVGCLDEEVNSLEKKIVENSIICRQESEKAQKEKVKRLEERKIAKIEKAKKRAERKQAIHDWLFEDELVENVDEVEEIEEEEDLDDNLVIIQNSDFRDSKFQKYSKKLSADDLVGRNYNTSPLYVFHNGSYYKVDSVCEPIYDMKNKKATVKVLTEAKHFALIFDIQIKTL